VRIVQITDLHLPILNQTGSKSLPDVKKEYELFERTVFRIAGLKVDLLVITGDILGIEEERDAVSLHVNSSAAEIKNIIESYKKIAEILTKITMRYMVLPGNHDHEKVFWQVFDRNADSIEINGYTLVCFADSLGDKQIPERRGRELIKFRNILSDTLKPRQIHIQHYLLTDPPEDDYPYSYKNYLKLQQEIVNSNNVLICLSGHYHKGINMFEKAKTFFSAGPAFCTPHRKYRIYQIQDRAVSYTDYNVL